MAREWTPDLAVGVKTIDDQHKELFRQVNSLLTAMSQGASEAAVGKTLEFLGGYVQQHFQLEESYMARNAYPATSSHKLQHHEFTRELGALVSRFQTEGCSATLVLALHKRATEWLVNHICKTDKLLGAYLKTKSAA